MPKIKNYGDSVEIWLSRKDTYHWASRTGSVWPCSTLSGKSIYACFDSNGLLDYKVNGRCPADFDSHEFNSMIADHLLDKVCKHDAVYFVTVGQFISEGSS